MVEAVGMAYPFLERELLSDETAEASRGLRRLMVLGRELGLSTAVTMGEAGLAQGDGRRRFERLVAVWNSECEYTSSVDEMVLHPAYQAIIGMGPVAVPWLLQELRKSGGHWFWALKAITGVDPTEREHRGDVERMKRDWLSWARRLGYDV